MGKYFTFLFIALLFLPRIVSDGMFLDGLLYASIARNMAVGNGSLWSPDAYGPFFDHPPLHFFLQSGFFRLLGDHWWVERLWCTIVLALNAVSIYWVAQKLFHRENIPTEAAWLVLFLWYLTPTISWGMPSNMLENLMGIPLLLSIGLLVNPKPRYILSGLLVFIGFLIKGPVALYPLAGTFAILYYKNEKISAKILFQATIPAISTIVGIALLLCYEPARVYLSTYFNEQIMRSLNGQREMGNLGWQGHFQVFSFLLTEMGPMLLFGLLVALSPLPKLGLNIPKGSFAFKLSISLFALAVFPLLISIKQRAYYLIPAIPWAAIAVAIWTYPKLGALNMRLQPKYSHWIKALLLVMAIGTLYGMTVNFARPGREKNLIQTMYWLKAQAPTGVPVLITPDEQDNYYLKACCMRYGRWWLSIHPDECNWAIAPQCSRGSTCYNDFVKPLCSDGEWEEAFNVGDVLVLCRKQAIPR